MSFRDLHPPTSILFICWYLLIPSKLFILDGLKNGVSIARTGIGFVRMCNYLYIDYFNRFNEELTYLITTFKYSSVFLKNWIK